ncbi:MAG: CDP-diacylglycerol--serine O-phosphatidyltransferase [Ignavibacteria bacterium]|nr:CDP-diacylglycerol--serine O-phosphatidyltransferase [Ignavibacteria bacterium]
MIFSKKFIPSLFTILNAICGFISVIESSKGEFVSSALFIIYAGMFDFFDGIIARFLKSSSKFGVELDSLADVISFGLAPSVLVYNVYFHTYNQIGILFSALFLIFSALRLARFNVELVGTDKEKFLGLPTPVVAFTTCSYLLLYHNKIFSIELSKFLIFILSLVIPVLMITKIEYLTFPKVNKKFIIEHPFKFSFLIFIIFITIITKGYAAFPLCVLYVLSGIFNEIKRIIIKTTHKK